MAMDFPFPPALLSGEILATTHFDPDQDRNNVLEIDRHWFVKAQWYLEGPIASYLGGTFHVQVVVEGIGRGDEETLATVDVPTSSGYMVGDQLMFSQWIHIPSRLENPNPNKVINRPGVYKLVLVLTYTRPTGKTGRIAGFTEGPMIQFYEPE